MSGGRPRAGRGQTPVPSQGIPWRARAFHVREEPSRVLRRSSISQNLSMKDLSPKKGRPDGCNHRVKVVPGPVPYFLNDGDKVASLRTHVKPK